MYDDFNLLKGRIEDVKKVEAAAPRYNPEDAGRANGSGNMPGSRNVRILLVRTKKRPCFCSEIRDGIGEIATAIHRFTSGCDGGNR